MYQDRRIALVCLQGASSREADMRFDGQRTVMVKEQQFELPALSNAQQVTLAIPGKKGEPEGGTHSMRSSAQLSDAVGSG